MPIKLAFQIIVYSWYSICIPELGLQNQWQIFVLMYHYDESMMIVNDTLLMHVLVVLIASQL